jgi:hypothetical protein
LKDPTGGIALEHAGKMGKSIADRAGPYASQMYRLSA